MRARSPVSKVAPSVVTAVAMAATALAPAHAIPPIGFLATPQGPVFGAAVRVDNLAVFPITLAVQDDPGPIMTLEDALAKGLAEVREVGGDGAPVEQRRVPVQRRHPNPAPNEPRQEQVQQILDGGSGATVGTLVIQNKGDVPLFVLAGTVVKGGNQDRQIGQDFVVDAKQTVPVDAFCVERGRWSGARDGLDTAGRFEAAQTLATSKVRAAGQHKKDQGEVWSKVSEANVAHGKQASSDTLLATLDAGDVAARTTAVAGRIGKALDAVDPGALVGFAYAIDGRIQGVRWFSSHRLFALYRDKLVRTAAVDALTAEAERTRAKTPEFEGDWPEGADVKRFVDDVEATALKERRDTPAANANEYKESERAFGARTVLKPKAAEKARPVSFDYLAK